MPRKKQLPVPNATTFSLNGPESLKREVSTELQRNSTENTLIYGEHDALPLKIARFVNSSPAGKACIDTKAKYIKGAGFSNPELEKVIIDKNGTTFWQFHCMLSDMLSLFEGFAVNFKYSGDGKITNSYPLSFESVRLTKPDDNGYITSVKYNPYFGTSEYRQDYTTAYPVFDPKQALNQIQNEGTDFKGQVYYYGKTSPIHRFYPVPGYWSAEHWIKIDANIQVFHSNNLDKGFFQTLVFNAIGDPSQPSKNPKYQTVYTDEAGVKRTKSTKTVGEEFGIMLSEGFAGADKAGGGITFWSGNHDTAVKMAAVPTNQNHDLFTALQALTDEKITQATLVPGILANIQRGVNLGSGGSEIQKAVELMQSRTEEERTLLESFYNDVMIPNLSVTISGPVEIVNFNPVTVSVVVEDKFWEVMTTEEKRAYVKKNVPGVELAETIPATAAPLPDGTPAPVPVEGEPAPPTEQANEALKGLKISDINKVQKIVARFNLSKVDPNNSKALTLDQAKQFLASYGFTEEQINAWLVTEEELADD